MRYGHLIIGILIIIIGYNLSEKSKNPKETKKEYVATDKTEKEFQYKNNNIDSYKDNNENLIIMRAD